MSKSNNPLITEIKNTKIKFNKTIYNNQKELFRNNQLDSNSIQPSQNYSTKNKYEKQKKLKVEFKTEKNINLSGPLKEEKDPEKQLLYYFKDKKIYIEIYNGQLNSSQTFYNLLLKYKIFQCKKLSKNIDYIVFKDGHLKTKKYAVLNNIKMVNPFWIDDKIYNHIFKNDEEYQIKSNFGDIVLREKYEKNKNDENNKEEENILHKNYELELEAEYDTEYAKKIDQLRENAQKKNNGSEIINDISNEDERQNNINEKKESDGKSNKITNEEIKRKKRRRKRNISNDNVGNLKIFNVNGENNNKETNKNIKNNDNNDKNISSSNNSKENKKKEQKKNKKNKSISELEKSSNKNNMKNTKIDENNNYILEFNEKNDKVLILPKQNEIKLNQENKKINIMTYKLEKKEINCLKTLNNFEYKGNLNNNENDNNIYNNANIIIVEQKKVMYDCKLYEFLLDKKIIVDFTSFLLEFINGYNSENNNNIDKLIEKINEISVNNEFYFFNRKKRMQKRTMILSLSIIDNIMLKDKKEQNFQKQNDIETKFYFMINQDINDNEKKIFQKLLKNYLKAKIINTNMPKNRSRSIPSQINLNLKKMIKKNNLEIIKEKEINKGNINNTKEYTKENNNDDIKKINKSTKTKGLINNNNQISDKNKPESENEIQKIEGTYLITKDKVNNIKFLSKIKYYKGIISYKYIYDSFINGQLLDLNDKNIFEKYQLQ